MLHLSCLRAIIMEMLAVYLTGFPTGIDTTGFPTGIMPTIVEALQNLVGKHRIPYEAAYEIQVKKYY